MSEPTRMEIVLYGRKNCKLCDEVEVSIRYLGAIYPLHLQVVDIETDPALHEEFMLVIPAVAIDGEVVFCSISHVVTLAELDQEFQRRGT